ncbi:MAG: DNA mismatch repair protein MutS, partial [Bacteroidota bacterium]
LKQVADLERLISKVAVGRVNPRELLQLKRSLQAILPVKDLLAAQSSVGLKKLSDQLHRCEFLLEKIEKELKEDAPMLLHQGGVIKDGVNAELDELRQLAFSGKDYLLQVQKREIERTGINSLKISYNKVFGYYLEVSNANKDKVPADWIRKQTLVNAERYITEELKVYEEKILHAEEKLSVIEQRLFNELVRHTSEFIAQIQQNARTVAVLDCLLSFALTARTNRYAKPEISDSTRLAIKAGRHPVIEKQLPVGETYVPNDIFLDTETQQILVITGPNMAGKSALLRQTALIVLMAQMGSFVPAESAVVGLVDKVFTRVGASDNLSRGESTFMVEMTETASILNNLSNRSLILMDEIGRGTSTYDGVSIAWAIVEYLHNHKDVRPKTLFATHYHELNQLAEDLPRVKNFNVSVKEVGDKIIFMRKLKEGGSEHSFGIHVAQLAGMPNPVVLRANDILHFLEKDKRKESRRKNLEE